MVHIHNLSVTNVSCDYDRESVSLCPTAMICLHTDQGSSPLRALLSVEYTQNFITEACAKKFNLPLSGGAPPIHIIDEKVRHILGKTKINISSRFDEGNVSTIDVLVADHIVPRLPASPLHTSVKEPLIYFHLADPTFDKPGEIDILLGSRFVWEILKEEEYSIPDTFSYAVDTAYGWIVMGLAPEEDSPEQFLTLN